MKKQLVLMTCLSALTAGAAIAGEQDARFKMLDANQDGYISAQEAQAHKGLTKQWGMLDQDSDNQLDQAEFSAFEMGMGSGSPSTDTQQDQ